MRRMQCPVKFGFLLLVLAGLPWADAAHGFGAEGHRVVGEIAEARLCAGARAWIAPLLDGNSLANAGTWADSIRDDPAWRHTRDWHFINVADGESLEQAMARPGGNVLRALASARRDLADTRLPRARRAEALRFFVHFTADLHQPLHVGLEVDRGGNDIPVRWGRRELSLHEFWDASALLHAQGLDLAGLAASIGALASGQEAAWQASGPQDWARESLALRPRVYALPAGGGRLRLDPQYVATARNLVSLRLAEAGVRLAGQLNQLGCPGAAAANPSR